ncbi:MAG: hypothetical protein B6U86_00725 [Candidatus Altiarchaeales archaeon ex4484_43]|nr:MAG: hypothetical protein B6U86_00725 [Candidatus Altiarchaeales archaeon ex4484_43]RLI88661.1 MAG: hypothetical protein DRO62_03300 [Candidatus Altiarchaeales archaeon]
MSGSVDYDLEINRILKEIKKSGAKFIGLQFPEGLKKYAVGIAKEIEDKSNATVIIFTDPVYGACDTKEEQSELLGLDLIVHFGHTNFR